MMVADDRGSERPQRRPQEMDAAARACGTPRPVDELLGKVAGFIQDVLGVTSHVMRMAPAPDCGAESMNTEEQPPGLGSPHADPHLGIDPRDGTEQATLQDLDIQCPGSPWTVEVSEPIHGELPIVEGMSETSIQVQSQNPWDHVNSPEQEASEVVRNVETPSECAAEPEEHTLHKAPAQPAEPPRECTEPSQESPIKSPCTESKQEVKHKVIVWKDFPKARR